MKKSTFNLIFGIAAGAFFSFLFTKDYYEKQSEERIKEMEKEVKAYGKKLSERNQKLKDELLSKVDEYVESVDDTILRGKKEGNYIRYDGRINASGESMDKAIKEAFSDSKKKYVETVNENYGDGEEEENDEDDEDEMPLYPREPREGPYSITPQSFADEFPWHDKMTLIYYEGDKTLIYGEGYEPVEIEDVGADFASHIGEFEAGTAYIRNELVGTDYEIILNKGAFEDIY